MKQFLFPAILVILMVSCSPSTSSSSASQGQNGDASFMYFKEESHDFGKVKEGDLVTYTFSVENRGKSDLIINNVQTSCGCTVAKFEKSPIKSGKSGTIELKLNTSGKNGKVIKTATVFSNAMPETKDLKLTCEVESSNITK